MLVLVLNCGSSSLKFQLIETDLERIKNNTDQRIAHGHIERIGGSAILSFDSDGKPSERSGKPIRDIQTAIEVAIDWLRASSVIEHFQDIKAVGHRVVHGGETFTSSVLITDEVIHGIEECIDLAPIHNPANLQGIRACADVFGPDVPQVAVFDTAFHQTLPEHAYLYAIPYQLYHRHRIRRYGFHGTSHRYVGYRYLMLRKLPKAEGNIITLHLGNGCSIAAIKNGAVIDTSMGFTPLEGLVMGTRSGDLDPAIVEFIGAKEGMTPHEVETVLNKGSGLLGLSGLTCDIRELIALAKKPDSHRARVAIEIFCYRASKYIGAYLAAMNGTDAIVFTGGIGENSAHIRSLICERLSWFGIHIDESLNETHHDGVEGLISSSDSRVSVYVVPTNEELLIARDAVRLISGV